MENVLICSRFADSKCLIRDVFDALREKGYEDQHFELLYLAF